MIRGTTAPFVFNIPNDFGTVNKIQAVFWQTGNLGTMEAPLPITKIYDNTQSPIVNNGFTINSTSISMVLTPDETLRFKDTMKASAQIKIYNSNSNKTYASHSQKFTVYPIENSDLLGLPSSIADPYEDIIYLDAGEL